MSNPRVIWNLEKLKEKKKEKIITKLKKLKEKIHKIKKQRKQKLKKKNSKKGIRGIRNNENKCNKRIIRNKIKIKEVRNNRKNDRMFKRIWDENVKKWNKGIRKNS